MPDGTPGTTSNGTPAAETANASATTASTVSGSPATRRVTERPSAGFGDQLARDVARGADGRADLGTVGDQRQHGLGYVGVGDDERRCGERVAGPDGEQSGVAGAGAHEGDPPRRSGRRCAVHLSRNS